MRNLIQLIRFDYTLHWFETNITITDIILGYSHNDRCYVDFGICNTYQVWQYTAKALNLKFNVMNK